MTDKILSSFLRRQKEEGEALAAASDLLSLRALDSEPCQRYLATFRCRGFVRRDGQVQESDHFEVGLAFSDDYLRFVDLLRTLVWLGPRDIFHPNVSDRVPVICLGAIVPGTPIVDLLHRLHDLITYRKVTMDENDALNHEACVWARDNQHRFPIDERPLKRRSGSFTFEPLEVAS